MMTDLSAKLKSEAAPNTDIISCRFPLDEEHWIPTKVVEDGPNPLWRYKQT